MLCKFSNIPGGRHPDFPWSRRAETTTIWRKQGLTYPQCSEYEAVRLVHWPRLLNWVCLTGTQARASRIPENDSRVLLAAEFWPTRGRAIGETARTPHSRSKAKNHLRKRRAGNHPLTDPYERLTFLGANTRCLVTRLRCPAGPKPLGAKLFRRRR